MAGEDDKKNVTDNFDLALKLAKDKLNRQSDVHKSLEAKIGFIFGFIAVIAGSIIVIVKDKTNLIGLNIFTLGVGGVFASLVLLVLALRTREYLDPPTFPVFYSADTLSKNNQEVKNQVIADMQASYKSNGDKHRLKSGFFNWALYLFLLSIVLLFLGVLENRPPNYERHCRTTRFFTSGTYSAKP